ncbi:laccase 1 [Mycena metata]|uniref:laccase n=1 Tax=Mycena metata TaxID=1033252 RepID=A0AAD7IAX1_9AGAR|nr:laccase 1 [Mycena metata]
MIFTALLPLCLVVCTGAVMIGPAADIHLVNAEVSPDGFPRSYGVLKGLGDTFNLNVIDRLTDNTMLRSSSIHWHGFFQKNNRYNVGPSFVNQCPIAANNSFLYTFPTGDQAGTFWHHSHLCPFYYCPTSAGDELRSALVVYDTENPHRSLYDSTTITLSDWFHAPIAEPDSILINGLGCYAGGPASPLAVVSVRVGKRYRFRLVSISCKDNFIFSIDGHKMTIIEVDSVNHRPLTHYSFVLTANQPVDNYWIRTIANLGPTGFDNGTNSAILRYIGAPVQEPSSTEVPTSVLPLVETNLHPLNPSAVPGLPVPGGANVTLNLIIGFDITGPFKFAINGAEFDPPTVPVLLRILSGAQTAADLLPAGSIYSLPPNKVIEISIPGGTIGAPHPFHLHGHNFHVIRSAGNSSYNFINPVRDNTTFRFVSDNAGPHIDLHLEAGLAIVLVEDTNTITKSTHPPAWNQLCPIYDALTPDQL